MQMFADTSSKVRIAVVCILVLRYLAVRILAWLVGFDQLRHSLHQLEYRVLWWRFIAIDIWRNVRIRVVIVRLHCILSPLTIAILARAYLTWDERDYVDQWINSIVLIRILITIIISLVRIWRIWPLVSRTIYVSISPLIRGVISLVVPLIICICWVSSPLVRPILHIPLIRVLLASPLILVRLHPPLIVGRLLSSPLVRLPLINIVASLLVGLLNACSTYSQHDLTCCFSSKIKLDYFYIILFLQSCSIGVFLNLERLTSPCPTMSSFTLSSSITMTISAFSELLNRKVSFQTGFLPAYCFVLVLWVCPPSLRMQ